MADEMLKRLLTATNPAEKAALVAHSVLASEGAVLAKLVPVLAFLRWFDKPVVKVLLAEDEQPHIAEIFAHLIELPFVESVTFGYTLHDLTRHGLLAEATKERRVAAAQAVNVYAQKEDSEGLLESFYCLVLGEQSDAAQKRLVEAIRFGVNQENWDELLSVFDSLYEAESLVGHEVITRDPLHWFAQGYARYHLNDLTGALANYSQAIQLDSKFSVAYHTRGDVRRALGDLTGALADYDKAIEYKPEFVEAYIDRARTYVEQGNLDGALADYDRAIQINPKSKYLYLVRGVTHRKLGNLELALVDFNRAIELNSDDAIAYYNRGVVHYYLDEEQAAIQDFDQAIQFNTEYAAAYRDRGLARGHLSEYHEAIRDYNRAIELNPKDAYAYNNRGVARAELGEHHAAITDFNRAIALDPEYADAYDNRGIARAELGKIHAAITDFGRAITLDPEFTSPLSNRANAYSKIEKFNEAIADYQALIRLDKSWLDAIGVNLGLLLSYVGRYEEAVTINRDYLSKAPNEYEACYNLAVALSSWKGATEAKAEISEARAILNTILDGENRPSGLYGLGGLEAIAGNAETALAYLKESAELPDSSAKEWAKHDIAWLDLRVNPDFQRIVYGESK